MGFLKRVKIISQSLVCGINIYPGGSPPCEAGTSMIHPRSRHFFFMCLFSNTEKLCGWCIFSAKFWRDLMGTHGGRGGLSRYSLWHKLREWNGDVTGLWHMTSSLSDIIFSNVHSLLFSGEMGGGEGESEVSHCLNITSPYVPKLCIHSSIFFFMLVSWLETYSQ